jgi:ligand-binding SRPBCC domain-containing protein
MPLLQLETLINANIQTCFDLARSVDFYQKSIKNAREIAIDGRTTGLVEANDFVVWEAKYFTKVQHITLKVTEFKNPTLFVDEMIQGKFKVYKHEHVFQEKNDKTLMIDKLYFESPWGFMGKCIDNLFLKKNLMNTLILRNKILKEKAEQLTFE